MEERESAALKINRRVNLGRGKINMILMVVVIGLICSGLIWWYHLQSTITTDNAKVSGDIVDVSPKAAGRLLKIAVSEQDTVKAGQIIARLDDSQYQIALDIAKANLEMAQANYDKLPTDVKSMQAAYSKAQDGVTAAQSEVKSSQVAVTDARRALEQTEALNQEGAASREALESARSRLSTAQATLEKTTANALSAMATLQDAEAKRESMQKTGSTIYIAQLKQAQANYNNAKLTLDNCTIKAPVSGTVIRVVAQEGENVAAGQTVFTICDLNSSWITANIEEKKIGRIKVGQEVQVRLDAYPGKRLTGRIDSIGSATQSTFALLPTDSGSGNYTKVVQRIAVKIKVDSPSVILKPGMSATVKIFTEDSKQR